MKTELGSDGYCYIKKLVRGKTVKMKVCGICEKILKGRPGPDPRLCNRCNRTSTQILLGSDKDV